MRRGFSLLETLLATGILIVVTLAIVALSNSLVTGTIINADKTIINRWAAEGIELTQKVRDDNVLGKVVDPASHQPSWFKPSVTDIGTAYGWYTINTVNNSTWVMTKVSSGNINASSFKSAANKLTSGQTVAYRLICVEAVSADATPALNDNNPFHCNTKGTTTLNDGSRSILNNCQSNVTPGQPNDLYCQMTKTSVNKNHLDSTRLIPAGSAVKIRSVVIWDEKDQIYSSSIASLITNWKGYEQ